jgi:hypothetical protein
MDLYEEIGMAPDLLAFVQKFLPDFRLTGYVGKPSEHAMAKGLRT